MHDHRYWNNRRLRLTQCVAVVATLAIATSIVLSHNQQRSILRDQFRAQAALKMVAARDHVESFLAEISLCLRLVSRDPSVRALKRDSRDYLQEIYEANHAQHHISEIYVISRDFDGSRPPFMAFEMGDESRDVQELHSLEREAAEYAIQIEQIRRFANDPKLEVLISEPVPLCVGEDGVVFSVPIRSEEGLVGIVAGMVPVSAISRTLEESSLRNQLVLTTDAGYLFTCGDVDSNITTQLRKRIADCGVDKFFATQTGLFRLGEFSAMWAPLSAPDRAHWYIVLLFPETRDLELAGVSSMLAGWGTATIVFLLGLAVVLLCQAVLATQSAQRQSDKNLAELTQSESRARAIVDTAADGVLMMDDLGRITAFNAAAERMFGYKAEEVIGHSAGMLAPPPDREKHDEYVSKHLRRAGGERKVVGMIGRKVEGVRKDGSRIPLEISVSQLRLSDRWAFTGILRDVSERREAERSLKESEERFRAIADYTYDWENWVDPAGKILWINPGVKRITGYSVEECMAMPGYPWLLILPEDRDSIADWTEGAVANLRSSGNDRTFRIRRKDKGIRWCAVSWQPIFDSDGGCLGHRSSIRDITDRKNAEEQSLRRQEELAHLTRVGIIGEMATEFAHELGQPLAAIANDVCACIEFLNGDRVRPDVLRLSLERAARQARRAGEIISRVRTFVRKRKVDRSSVDLNELAHEAVGLISASARSRHVDIVFDLDSAIPHVSADHVQIAQVIVNLLQNGIEAMGGHGNGASKKLIIRTVRPGTDQVELSVRDQGPGFDTRFGEQVFEAFFTTKPQGMGMGLAISRTIIEAHGGCLLASANPGDGAVFRFNLPICHELD